MFAVPPCFVSSRAPFVSSPCASWLSSQQAHGVAVGVAIEAGARARDEIVAAGKAVVVAVSGES